MDAIDRINIRLKAMLGYLKRLEKYKGITAIQLKADQDRADIIERNLQLAIEAVIDISNLLNAEFRFRQADTAQESILILGEEGVLNKEFAKKFAPTAGLRNILVHDYLKIDYNKIADQVNSQLKDFRQFAKAIADHLS